MTSTNQQAAIGLLRAVELLHAPDSTPEPQHTRVDPAMGTPRLTVGHIPLIGRVAGGK